MELMKIDEAIASEKYTALLYCPPGVGKSTAIGLIAEASEGNTLVLDVDRTIVKTLAKKEVVKDTSKIFRLAVDNLSKNVARGRLGTFDSWKQILNETLTPDFIAKNDIRLIAVDNISELERCILSDLGAQGKNKGVPAMADYQYMQFRLVNSLRYMKSLGVNVIWTAWETTESFTSPDGTQYSRVYPKISTKILDNICGLCDVVGRIFVNKGEHGIMLSATQNVYAKNQIDARKACRISSFAKFKKAGTDADADAEKRMEE